jgi:hypothetical protein
MVAVAMETTTPAVARAVPVVVRVTSPGRVTTASALATTRPVPFVVAVRAVVCEAPATAPAVPVVARTAATVEAASAVARAVPVVGCATVVCAVAVD